LLSAEPQVTYLATGGDRADDTEWLARVAGHRRRRPAGWITVESMDVAAVLAAATHPVLLDCLGTWLTARMDHHRAWRDPRALNAVDADMAELVATWRALTVPVVAVSNEVGSGVVPAAASGRLFRDLLGRLNTQIAAQSETVLLTVAGLSFALREPAVDDG
jgi:adenosylcobinamide kinase/adenosylcobinamide-phosphate guanylyltransferase